MTEMVERCAQAIRDAGHVFAREDNYERIVRIVLESAREPTFDMKMAGAPAISEQMPKHGVQADYDAAHDGWRAMIGEALK